MVYGASETKNTRAKCRLCSRPMLAVLGSNCGEGWGKQKHFIQAKTLEKIYANQNENKKPPENPTPYPFIYHFSRKRYPFHIPSISDKWCPSHIPCLEFCIPFDCCKPMHCFFFT